MEQGELLCYSSHHVWLFQELPCPSSKIWSIWQRCQPGDCLQVSQKNKVHLLNGQDTCRELFTQPPLGTWTVCFASGKGKGRGETLQKFISYIITLTTCWKKRKGTAKETTVVEKFCWIQSLLQQRVPFCKQMCKCEREWGGKREGGKKKETCTHPHTTKKKKKNTYVFSHFLFKMSTSTNLKANFSTRSKCTELTIPPKL